MLYPVFLSCPQPYLKLQEEFLRLFRKKLQDKNLDPRTIGETDYTMDSPLEGIRSLMLVTNGLVAVALKRHHVVEGASKDASDMGYPSQSIAGKYFTSPFCHIEPAMAFQLGLPVLVLREKGVIEEGMLEPRATGMYTAEFSTDSMEEIYKFLDSRECNDLLDALAHRVMSVHRAKGKIKLWSD